MKKEDKKSSRYFASIGRRKTAIAEVRLISGTDRSVVNGKGVKEYFHSDRLQGIALEAIEKMKLEKTYYISVLVHGGGLRAQAEAVRHGVARSLVLADEGLKKRLRAFGFLTRDSRMVERKKYGLKKARRAPQWQKR